MHDVYKRCLSDVRTKSNWISNLDKRGILRRRKKTKKMQLKMKKNKEEEEEEEEEDLKQVK
jgi:hypothetical protein